MARDAPASAAPGRRPEGLGGRARCRRNRRGRHRNRHGCGRLLRRDAGADGRRRCRVRRSGIGRLRWLGHWALAASSAVRGVARAAAGHGRRRGGAGGGGGGRGGGGGAGGGGRGGGGGRWRRGLATRRRGAAQTSRPVNQSRNAHQPGQAVCDGATARPDGEPRRPARQRRGDQGRGPHPRPRRRRSVVGASTWTPAWSPSAPASSTCGDRRWHPQSRQDRRLGRSGSHEPPAGDLTERGQATTQRGDR
jgi:hypothetical protein